MKLNGPMPVGGGGGGGGGGDGVGVGVGVTPVSFGTKSRWQQTLAVSEFGTELRTSKHVYIDKASMAES
jgi:hypothetical protein